MTFITSNDQEFYDNSSFFDNSTFSDLMDLNNTTTNNSTLEEAFYPEGNYFALLLIIVPCMTVFGNMLVIMSVYRERALQTITNYFIVSLALADLLVAVGAMPFAVYSLTNGSWGLPAIVCDIFIATDVTCSTSSILNLVAISIDRYIAVTRPISYARHRSNMRVWTTIGAVWLVSLGVGSPLVFLGLNNTPQRQPDLCLFYNSDFIIYSSLTSFYIPCFIMIILYYSIFKALRNRASKKARASRGAHFLSNANPGIVIENVAQTRRIAETTMGTTVVHPSSGGGSSYMEEVPTNTGSGSQDDEDEDRSPGSEDCHVIRNERSTDFILATVVEESAMMMTLTSPQIPDGNHDSGYVASNIEETVIQDSPVETIPLEIKSSITKLKSNGNENHTRESIERNKRAPLPGRTSSEDSTLGTKKEKKTSSGTTSRFTMYRGNRSSRKKREKNSVKRERKATKTLAIVLGVFLICWLPFFTCNIMDAICTKTGRDCHPGLAAFILTTWLGYMNSFVNPIIYTIFNPEFRKAFKKIMHIDTK